MPFHCSSYRDTLPSERTHQYSMFLKPGQTASQRGLIMNIRCYRRLSLSLIGCCLIFLLAACGSGSPTREDPTPSAASTSPAHGSSTPTPKLPPTQTSCPAAGTARAAVMTPLTLGSHQKIVFSVSIGSTEKLQVVRMDGQELQTLYCGSSASSFYNLQWSANQHLIVFVTTRSDMYLLHVQSGSLQRVFHPKTIGSNGIEGYRPETWLDATRLYVLTQPLDQPADTLSILDITRGNDQDSNNLQQVAHVAPTQSGFCWNTDSNYDATSLFISQCTGGDPRGGVTQGPSTINVEPAAGGSQHTIYSSSTLAITAMRSITNDTLFYSVGNTTGDTSKNGVWKINTDGTGNTFLTSISVGGPNSTAGLNQFTQYPWSNFSRDNRMYALEQFTAQNGTVTNTLLFGSLHGGSPTTFASISGTELAIVGWTTM